MSMQKEITDKEYGYSVDTREGIWFIPSSVSGLLDKPEPSDLQNYVEPVISDTDEIETIYGYFGRWQMPGYTDCTEWTFAKTKRDLLSQLRQY